MPAAKRKSPMTVSAPLVQVQVSGQVLHLHHGDIVPEGVDEDSLKHLKSLGYVTDGDESDGSDDK